MKLVELLEGVQESSLHQLRSVAGNLAAFLERDLPNLLHDSYARLVDNGADKIFKKLKFVLGSRKARWFNENYFTSRARRSAGVRPALLELSRDPKFRVVHHELKELSDLPIQGHIPTRLEKGQTASKHFAKIVQLLPDILETVGERVSDGKSLTALGERIRAANIALHNEFERMKEKHNAVAPAPKAPKVRNDLPGQQSSAVEDIVNQTIKSLVPRNLQGEVRNRVARAANKLAALQVELDRLGIKT